jgi:hypothetical protein
LPDGADNSLVSVSVGMGIWTVGVGGTVIERSALVSSASHRLYLIIDFLAYIMSMYIIFH